MTKDSSITILRTVAILQIVGCTVGLGILFYLNIADDKQLSPPIPHIVMGVFYLLTLAISGLLFFLSPIGYVFSVVVQLVQILAVTTSEVSYYLSLGASFFLGFTQLEETKDIIFGLSFFWGSHFSLASNPTTQGFSIYINLVALTLFILLFRVNMDVVKTEPRRERVERKDPSF